MRSVQTRWIPQLFAMSLMVLLGACSPKVDEALTVRQFHLRETEPADKKKAQMVRGEQMKLADAHHEPPSTELSSYW